MRKNTSGYVLIATILVAVLLSAITLLIVSNATSEIRQSGGDMALSTTRAAAEAAQADAAYYLVNQGLTDINNVLQPYVTRFARSNNDAASTPILQTSDYAGILNAINALSGMQIAGTVNGVAYTATVNFPPRGLAPDQSSFKSKGQNWYLNYTIVANANTGTSYQRNVSTNGQLRVRLGRTYLNQFVLLADDGGWNNGNNGGFFGTGSAYDGPVHFNGDVAFAGTPSFLYGVTTNAGSVAMYNCSRRQWENVSTQSDNCTSPNWNGKGIQYSVPKVDMPHNAFSQQNAALGLSATDGTTATSAPNQGQECRALGLSCAGGGVADGVYVPQNNGVVSGGIYIKGDASSVVLSTLPGTPLSKQVYTITDSSNKITTITVDYTARTTTIGKTNPISVAVLPGVPNGQMFSTGSINNLKGPPRTVDPLPTPVPDDAVPTSILPAVAAASQLNIAAANDVTVTGDVVYEQDPRSIPSATNVLGIISGTGNIHVGMSAPSDLYLQGALLSGNTGMGLVVDGLNTIGYKGGLHLLGSTAEQSDGLRGVANGAGGTLSSGYDDAFHFDKRFLNGGSVPPFFPATTMFQAQSSWPDQQGWREQ